MRPATAARRRPGDTCRVVVVCATAEVYVGMLDGDKPMADKNFTPPKQAVEERRNRQTKRYQWETTDDCKDYWVDRAAEQGTDQQITPKTFARAAAQSKTQFGLVVQLKDYRK